MRRGQEIPTATPRQLDERRGLLQCHRHRLLDQHVLASLERCAGDRPMLRHRGQHQHQIDRFGFDQRAIIGAEGHIAEALRDDRLRGRVDIAGGDYLDRHAHALHALDLPRVRPAHHAAAANDTDSDRVWCHS